MEYWFVLLAVAAIAAFSLMLSIRLLRVVRNLQEQVRILQNLPPKVPDQAEPTAPVSFSTSLSQAEQKVAESQIQFKGGSQADKYRYLASLAGQGLDSAAIAAALQMSPVEVEQLLSLARLRPQGQAAVNEG